MTGAGKVTRVALVTGAAQGIGLAIARRLASVDRVVVLTDRQGDAAETAARQLGSNAFAVAADVSDESSVSDLIAEVERRHGRLDIVVNCAGIMDLVDGVAVETERLPLDLWERVIAVNLTGPFLVCRAAAPVMKRAGWGRIVNIASRAARMRAGTPAYSASKGGLVALSRVLAGELGPHGITVNCVAPSRVSTPLTATISSPALIARKIEETPMRRLAEAADVAGAVAYLVSDEASFVTGSIVDVNGGSFMTS